MTNSLKRPVSPNGDMLDRLYPLQVITAKRVDLDRWAVYMDGEAANGTWLTVRYFDIGRPPVSGDVLMVRPPRAMRLATEEDMA